MRKAKYNLTDLEIMRKRDDGATIKQIAEESGVSYGTMHKKLISLQNSKDSSEVKLYDTLGDGNGGFWMVAEITDKHYVIKNRETGRTDKISRRLFESGETMYHKLNTPPVTVYNLNDADPPEEKHAEDVKEPAEKHVKLLPTHPQNPQRRKYIERIERILDAAQPECQSEEQCLYELVSEMFRNGFDKEFMGK